MISRPVQSLLGASFRRLFCLALAALALLLLSPSASAQSPTYATMLRVVVAWDSFTSNTWEQAAPIRSTPSYEQYEATVWPNAVHLYRFGVGFDPSLYGYQPGQAWADYRESFRLMKVDLPAGLSPQAKSRAISAAFVQFFARILQDTPSQHLALRYAGHGMGTGALFQSTVLPDEARFLLAQVVRLYGRKLDFIDLGGNCAEGTFLTLANLYPYADYILASSESVGGYSMDDWTFEKFVEINPDYNFPLLLTPERTIEQTLLAVMAKVQLGWVYSQNNMTTGQVRQSLSLYDTSQFEDLIRAVQSSLRPAAVYSWSRYHNDLYTYIHSLGSPVLEEKFVHFRKAYISNKDFFVWPVDTNGFSVRSAQDLMAFQERPLGLLPLRLQASGILIH